MADATTDRDKHQSSKEYVLFTSDRQDVLYLFTTFGNCTPKSLQRDWSGARHPRGHDHDRPRVAPSCPSAPRNEEGAGARSHNKVS